ncbi:hypothetical protein LNQ03_08525 [Klebsiella pneumoniae subsp. pneumoniae]|nr:hypothetical protein [Klebsiella pneumoniae subsp. pneumoniae]
MAEVGFRRERDPARALPRLHPPRSSELSGTLRDRGRRGADDERQASLQALPRPDRCAMIFQEPLLALRSGLRTSHGRQIIEEFAPATKAGLIALRTAGQGALEANCAGAQFPARAGLDDLPARECPAECLAAGDDRRQLRSPAELAGC